MSWTDVIDFMKREDMDNSLNKKYYKIREVSEMLDLPLPTLRFWEKNFTVLHPRRNEGGTRFYTPADVETLRMIKYLVKDKGLKLAAAEEMIRRNHTGVSRHSRAVEKLVEIRNTLRGLSEALQRMR